MIIFGKNEVTTERKIMFKQKTLAYSQSNSSPVYCL